MNDEARALIERYNLEPHPEGGYYRRTYESDVVCPAERLPDRFEESRRSGSAILYLLPGDEVSRFHRLPSDETWHFYEGGPIRLHVLTTEGDHRVHRLGREEDMDFQVTISANQWFGAEPVSGYSFVGCTVSPEFRFEDLELANREQLLESYPEAEPVIRRLTPE